MDDEIPLHNYSPAHGDNKLAAETAEYAIQYDNIVTGSTNNMESKEKYKELKKEFGEMNMNKDSNSNIPRRKQPPKRIDYVLVYDRKTLEEINDPEERRTFKKNILLREKFELALRAEGFEIQEDVLADVVYIKIHTPFKRLCLEAERCKLQMSLEGCEIYDDGSKSSFWTRFEDKHLETDNEIDFVSAPFARNKLHIYDGHENEDTFFRPAIRCFLTDHILINMDIRDKTAQEKEEDPLARKGLPYLLHKEVYKESLILHDETADDPMEREEIENKLAEKGEQMSQEQIRQRRASVIQTIDTRKELDEAWCKKWTKYQPLWKIRNYFGEKIALYFAWSGTLITSLWIPTIFGIAVFIYGLVLRFSHIDSFHNRKKEEEANNNTTLITAAKEILTESLDLVKEAFDNEATPYFALVICLWGTIFLEIWKRKNATLAYEWDVDNFEDTEPDRPQFFGTKMKPDPVTMEETWYYPMKKQAIKFLTSGSVLIIMVILVFISAAAVILYRVIMSIDFCDNSTPTECLLLTTVLSSLLNTVSIMVLGKVYDKLAIKLTDWENHRTQTQYDDALILKLFAFQFANCYTSLFYIAFFRGYIWPDGIFGMGAEYQDTCSGDYNVTASSGSGSSSDTSAPTNSCMSMLSFQVLTLMLLKPFPKFFKDVILQWFLKKWKKRTWCRKTPARVEDEDAKVPVNNFLERERIKPVLGDFTLGEYTEKIIIYGYLMLFAASFSLAPLIVLLVNVIDIRVDAKRMVWWYRRPVSRIAQDIGMWYNILQFLNICGVISNAFLVAFTSTWGQQYGEIGQLWVVIIFEHLVLGLKFVLNQIIPDVPKPVRLAMRREKYQVNKILERATSDTHSSLSKKFNFLSPLLLVQNKSLTAQDQERKREDFGNDSDGFSAAPPSIKQSVQMQENVPRAKLYTSVRFEGDPNPGDPVTSEVVEDQHAMLSEKDTMRHRSKKKKKRRTKDVVFQEPGGINDNSNITVAQGFDYDAPTSLPRMLTPMTKSPRDNPAGGTTPRGSAALLRTLPMAVQGLESTKVDAVPHYYQGDLSYGADGSTYIGQKPPSPKIYPRNQSTPSYSQFHIALPENMKSMKTESQA